MSKYICIIRYVQIKGHLLQKLNQLQKSEPYSISETYSLDSAFIPVKSMRIIKRTIHARLVKLKPVTTKIYSHQRAPDPKPLTSSKSRNIQGPDSALTFFKSISRSRCTIHVSLAKIGQVITHTYTGHPTLTSSGRRRRG